MRPSAFDASNWPLSIDCMAVHTILAQYAPELRLNTISAAINAPLYTASVSPAEKRSLGHIGVFNSLKLSELGITVDTSAPAGERIGIENGKLTGYLEENAFIESVKKVPLSSIEDMVKRITKAGIELGTDECIDVMDALKAVTINYAYQYGEKNEKGSIEYCKTADFVILDKDTMTVAPEDIRNINVLQTIKNAKSIYKIAE